jgi:hypothetical protein
VLLSVRVQLISPPAPRPSWGHATKEGSERRGDTHCDGAWRGWQRGLTPTHSIPCVTVSCTVESGRASWPGQTTATRERFPSIQMEPVSLRSGSRSVSTPGKAPRVSRRRVASPRTAHTANVSTRHARRASSAVMHVRDVPAGHVRGGGLSARQHEITVFKGVLAH